MNDLILFLGVFGVLLLLAWVIGKVSLWFIDRQPDTKYLVKKSKKKDNYFDKRNEEWKKKQLNVKSVKRKQELGVNIIYVQDVGNFTIVNYDF